MDSGPPATKGASELAQLFDLNGGASGLRNTRLSDDGKCLVFDLRVHAHVTARHDAIFEFDETITNHNQLNLF